MLNFLNECTDCGNIEKEGLWKIEGKIGSTSIKEYVKVGPEESVDPKNFDLDVIDVKKLSKKYNVLEDDMLDLISNGEICCPKCKSLNYFSK